MRKFKGKVLDRQHGPSTANIVLSTIHAAKGNEWDHVQVLAAGDKNGLCSLLPGFTRRKTRGSPAKPAQKAAGGITTAARERTLAQTAAYEFDFPFHKDSDLNLWYVALTRARKTLSIPPVFTDMIEALVHVRRAAHDRDCGGPACDPATNEHLIGEPNASGKQVQEQCNPGMIQAVNRSIVEPWRQSCAAAALCPEVGPGSTPPAPAETWFDGLVGRIAEHVRAAREEAAEHADADDGGRDDHWGDGHGCLGMCGEGCMAEAAGQDYLDPAEAAGGGGAETPALPSASAPAEDLGPASDWAGGGEADLPRTGHG